MAFGAVGLPVRHDAARTAGLDPLDVAPVNADFAMLCLVVPFLMLQIMDGKRGVKQVWPFGLFCGIVFGATKWIVASTPLYNLTEIFAAIITVCLAMLFLKVWKPVGGAEAVQRIGIPIDPSIETQPVKAKKVDTSNLTGSRIVMALVPYILVIVIFLIATVHLVRRCSLLAM